MTGPSTYRNTNLKNLQTGKFHFPNTIYVAMVILLMIYATMSYLGFLPVSIESDEPIRALVSTEMEINSNYLTPTLNGELYFNKPPLYNWIILASFRLFNSDSSFALRFPMIVSFFLLGAMVYYFVRRNTNNRLAWLAAFTAITHGRLIYYDTLLGLIDLCYACITYLSFMVIYDNGRRGRWAALFLLSWGLTAVGSLMKGYTSPVFQGITLVVYFFVINPRQWRRLFGIWNMLGILLFMAILLSYYIPYFRLNDITPLQYFRAMFVNSSRGTPLSQEIGRVFVHFIGYPFHMLYDFAPWMLLTVMFIRKDFIAVIKNNEFIFFNAAVFIFNFLIYWLSPDTFARYIFMLLPLLFTTGSYFYLEKTPTSGWQRKLMDYCMFGSMILATLAITVLPIFSMTKNMPMVYPKVIFLFLAMTCLIWLSLKNWSNLIFLFVIAILVIRVGFNWFVIEQRGYFDRKSVLYSSRIKAITGDNPVFIYGKYFDAEKSPIGPKNGISYNITRQKRDIVRYSEKRDSSVFYLALKKTLDTIPHRTYYVFLNTRKDTDSLVLFKFR
jgi:4-amino-4-deoxy-L-arabinose transferase-like glycosyltransferase